MIPWGQHSATCNQLPTLYNKENTQTGEMELFLKLWNSGNRKKVYFPGRGGLCIIHLCPELCEHRAAEPAELQEAVWQNVPVLVQALPQAAGLGHLLLLQPHRQLTQGYWTWLSYGELWAFTNIWIFKI